MDMFLVPIAYTHMCVYRRLLTPSGNMFDTGQQLPPRQAWGRKFLIYGALGIPNADLTGWKLQVDVSSGNPSTLSYGARAAVPRLLSAFPSKYLA